MMYFYSEHSALISIFPAFVSFNDNKQEKPVVCFTEAKLQVYQIKPNALFANYDQPKPTAKTISAFDKALKPHFQSAKPAKVSDEELKADLKEAITNLPKDKFISTRSLTHLDALMAFAFKKYGSAKASSQILYDCLSSLAEKDMRISKQTKAFLQRAHAYYQTEPSDPLSLRALLNREYNEEDLESDFTSFVNLT